MIRLLPQIIALLVVLPGFAQEAGDPAEAAPAEDSTPAETQPPEGEAPVKMTVQVDLPDVSRLADEELAGQEKMDAVVEEMAAMRTSLEQLQQTLDLLVNNIMADLEAENRQLRGELDRLRARESAGVLTLPGVPLPGDELVTRMIQEQNMAGAEGEAVDLPPQEFGFEVLDEWGRAPDLAKQLGDSVTSLKGMVLVVPPKSAEEDLTNLGLDLRTQYADYDNINIEVFDDAEAARNYINTQTASPAHRVLSVSKHAASGRDLILLIDGETTEEVAF
jgi:hypothetical protein